MSRGRSYDFCAESTVMQEAWMMALGINIDGATRVKAVVYVFADGSSNSRLIANSQRLDRGSEAESEHVLGSVSMLLQHICSRH